MTDEQFDRLPGLFKEIVTNARELRELKGAVVEYSAAKEKLLRKRELRAHAAKQYGVRLGGGGSATA